MLRTFTCQTLTACLVNSTHPKWPFYTIRRLAFPRGFLGGSPIFLQLHRISSGRRFKRIESRQKNTQYLSDDEEKKYCRVCGRVMSMSVLCRVCVESLHTYVLCFPCAGCEQAKNECPDVQFLFICYELSFPIRGFCFPGSCSTGFFFHPASSSFKPYEIGLLSPSLGHLAGSPSATPCSSSPPCLQPAHTAPRTTAPRKPHVSTSTVSPKDPKYCSTTCRTRRAQPATDRFIDAAFVRLLDDGRPLRKGVICSEVERVVFPEDMEANGGRGDRMGSKRARNRERVREAARRAVVFGGFPVSKSRMGGGNGRAGEVERRAVETVGMWGLRWAQKGAICWPYPGTGIIGRS
jgi:hypothetical protein